MTRRGGQSWMQCPVMPALPLGEPAAPCSSFSELVAWLQGATLPPGPLRTSRCTMVTDMARHKAYLLGQAFAARGQQRVGVWAALQRLYDAVEGDANG